MTNDDAHLREMEADWLGGMDRDLRRAGLDKYAASGMNDGDVAGELSALNGGTAQPGGTGNARARALATILHHYQHIAAQVVTQVGGWAVPGSVAPMVHDPEKIRGLSTRGFFNGDYPSAAPAQAAWSRFVLRCADLDRTFGGRDAARQALPQLWTMLANAGAWADADQASALPIIVWKSPQDWAAYNARYGAGTVVAAVVAELRRCARLAASMQTFGIRPGRDLEAQLLHGQVLGDAGPTQGLVPAIAAKAAALRYRGVPFLAWWQTLLMDTFGRIANAAERREAVEIVAAGIDARIADIARQFGDGQARPGLACTIENLVFKYTGLTALTENLRGAAEHMMARWAGLRQAAEFLELSPELRVVLGRTGIGQPEWDLLRAADWTGVGDAAWFEPTIVDRLDVAALADYAGARGALPEDAQMDLRQRILSFVHDAGIKAALEETAPAGASPGALIRLVGRFDAFFAAMSAQTWRREIYGGGPVMDRVAGIVEPMAAALVLGYAAIALRDVALGRAPGDPAAPATVAAAFMAGGGPAIYADLLLGNRAGGAEDADLWMTGEIIDFLFVHRLQEYLEPGYLQRTHSQLERQNHPSWWLPSTSALH